MLEEKPAAELHVREYGNRGERYTSQAEVACPTPGGEAQIEEDCQWKINLVLFDTSAHHEEKRHPSQRDVALTLGDIKQQRSCENGLRQQLWLVRPNIPICIGTEERDAVETRKQGRQS